ncbi:MAG: hypothetical protein OXQ92_10220 [Boseongicola sp.]|nr:hypothetical protein [Boseongicola sp.]MDD9977119.1 hypothetical protein [Boseongicola sp.]
MGDMATIDASPAARLSHPVFFMHIAKTAGSYLNACLSDAVGPDRMLTHIENRLGSDQALASALSSGIEVFSGHVMLGLWDKLASSETRKFRLVTMVREPIAHIASHIHWLDHYNRPDKRPGYRALDEDHRRIVDRIGSINLKDVGQLDAFLTGLSGTEMRLLDNCQSRYFIMSGGRDIETTRPMTLMDRDAVSNAMRRFSVIACQDNLDRDIGRISLAIGIRIETRNERINVAQSERRIDIENPVIRQVLSKRTLVDQWLWRHVVKGSST